MNPEHTSAPTLLGIHHITAITGDPQANLDFYAGVLGMRLVKRSVNQDMPGTYHLFYADADGSPGTDLTFFPWADSPKARPGVGMGTEIALAVPAGSLAYWKARLSRFGVAAGGDVTTRFGESVLPLTDPFGQPLVLVEVSDDARSSAAVWERSPVPVAFQVRGLHAVRVEQRDLVPTADFLTGPLGFRLIAEENSWQRYGVAGGGSGAVIDVRSVPGALRRGEWGVGSIHHVAWRVADEEAERAVRARVAASRATHRPPTDVIDRFWFKSVYFMEPGGVLFELATDGPGFAVDESPATLGESIVLPPWLEAQRTQIEAGLPVLHLPDPAVYADPAGNSQ